MDLTPLRPRADTPDATLEAINRCTIAGSGCLALIERLKQERVDLLLSGKPDQLRQNTADLADAINDATEIRDLSDHLQSRLKQLAPEQIAEIAAQQRAVAAAAAMSEWWTTNAALVTEGLQKMGVAFAALGELQAAMARTTAGAEVARSASNVAPFQRPPGAA